MQKKDPAAVKLGRKGGLRKVPKGTALLTAARRAEVGRMGAAARWKKRPDSNTVAPDNQPV